MSSNPLPGYIYTVATNIGLIEYTQPISENLNDMPTALSANVHLKVNSDATALVLDSADVFNGGLYQELIDVNWSARTPQYVLTVNNAGNAIVYQQIPGGVEPPSNAHIFNGQNSIPQGTILDLNISPPGFPVSQAITTYDSPPAIIDSFDFVNLSNGFRPLFAGNYAINCIFNFNQYQYSSTSGNIFTQQLILYDSFLQTNVAQSTLTINTFAIPIFPAISASSIQLNTNVFLNNNGNDDRYQFILKVSAVTTVSSYSYQIRAQNFQFNVGASPAVGIELLLRDLSHHQISVVSPGVSFQYFPASVVNPIVNNGFTLTNPITIHVDTADVYNIEILNNFSSAMLSSNDVGQISVAVFLFDANMQVLLQQSVITPVSEIPLFPSFSSFSNTIDTQLALPVGNYTVQVLCNIFTAGIWNYQYTNELFEVHLTLGELVNPSSFVSLQDVALGGTYVNQNETILTINQDNTAVTNFPSNLQALVSGPANNITQLTFGGNDSYADVAKFFYLDENEHFHILLRPRTRFHFGTNVPADGDILFFGHTAFQQWDTVNAIRTFNGAGEQFINISDNFPLINQTTDARGPESTSRIIANGFPEQVWQATYIPASDGRVSNSAFPAFLNIQFLDFQIPTKNYATGGFINRSVYQNLEVDVTISAYIMVPVGSQSTSAPLFIQTGFTHNRIVDPATTPSILATYTDTTSQQMPWYWFGANLGKIYKTWRINLEPEDIIIPVLEFYPVGSSTQAITLVSYQLDIIEV